MDKFELLNKYIDAVINKTSPEALHEIFKEFVTVKSKEVLYPETLTEFVGEDSPVKLKANEVFVNGKKVGMLKNDPNDMEGGINFTTIDGKYSKEFDSIQHLYRFLIKNFANSKTQQKELVDESVDEKDCEDCKLDTLKKTGYEKATKKLKTKKKVEK